MESKLTIAIDEELIKYGFYLEYACDGFLEDLPILSRLSRVTCVWGIYKIRYFFFYTFLYIVSSSLTINNNLTI